MIQKLLIIIYLNYLKKIKSSKIFSDSVLSIIYNGFALIIGFITVSILVNWLGEDLYGKWITLYAVCIWMNYFDGGIGNSIRNELTASLTKKSIENSKTIIFTGYCTVLIFIFILSLIILLIHYYIDWNLILSDDSLNFNLIALFVFISFLFQLFLKIIGKILFSFSLATLNFFLIFINNLFILISIILLKHSNFDNKIINVAVIYSIVPIFIFLTFTIYIFYFKKKKYRPTITNFDIKLIPKLLFKGISFFFIQISSGVIQALLPIFITYFFQSSDTTEFQIAIQYYMLFVVLQNILLQTNWIYITKAKIVNDHIELKKTFKRNLLTCIVLCFLLLIFYTISDTVYKLWINKNFIIKSNINLLSFIFVLILLISKVFINFLSAINETKIQSYFSIILLLSFVPLLYLSQLTFSNSLEILLIVPVILVTVQLILAMLQTKKILYENYKIF